MLRMRSVDLKTNHRLAFLRESRAIKTAQNMIFIKTVQLKKEIEIQKTMISNSFCNNTKCLAFAVLNIIFKVQQVEILF